MYLSEAEVKDMCDLYDLIPVDEEEENDND